MPEFDADISCADDVVQMFRLRLEAGWSAAFVTFKFNQMPGGVEARCRQQEREVVAAYGRLATRVVRHPTSRSATRRLPFWIGSPDFPVWKREKQSLQDVTVNDGQHIHMMTATPPDHRFDGDFCSYVRESQHLFQGRGFCRHVHAKPITHDLPRVTRYLTKSIDRRRFGEETLIVLPRSLSELRPSRRPIGRNSSILAAGTAAGSTIFTLGKDRSG